MQIGSLKHISRQEFEFLKIPDGVGRHFETVKLQYLRHHLTKFDKIACMGTQGCTKL